jgi:hypothetical protein
MGVTGPRVGAADELQGEEALLNVIGIALVGAYMVVFVIAVGLLLFGSIGFAGFALWVVMDALGLLALAAIVSMRA